MPYALTSKSQVTLPKRVREHLRLKPGDAVEFLIQPDGAVVVEPVNRRSFEEALEKVRGSWRGPPADEWLMSTRGSPDETGE